MSVDLGKEADEAYLESVTSGIISDNIQEAFLQGYLQGCKTIIERWEAYNEKRRIEGADPATGEPR